MTDVMKVIKLNFISFQIKIEQGGKKETTFEILSVAQHK